MGTREKAKFVASLFLAMTLAVLVILLKIRPGSLVWYGWIFGAIGLARSCELIWKFICGIAEPDEEPDEEPYAETGHRTARVNILQERRYDK